MISQQTTYDHERRAVWVPRFIDWANAEAADRVLDARAFAHQGKPRLASDYLEIAARYRGYADRARVLLVDLSDVTADEPPAHKHTSACPITDCPFAPATSDAPPSTLVAFTGWLIEKLGRWLPWVSSETWQTCAALIQMDRERARGGLLR